MIPIMILQIISITGLKMQLTCGSFSNKVNMFRGFNLTLKNNDVLYYYKHGTSLYESYKDVIINKISSFVDYDGSLNADKMKTNWFPKVKADIFLSHSHKDEKFAISLAGWFYHIFGLTTFIDSCIWGYADELLQMIDDKYCLNSNKETYNYKKRNYSTSHIHMMLSTALTMMIDKTECLIFLNTPNSITPHKTITDKNGTYSPWIYSEIAISQLIRKKSLNEHRGILKKADALFSESQLKIKYGIDLSHLYDINIDTLNQWKKKADTFNHDYPLDILYDICS